MDAMPATMPAAEVTATPIWWNLYTVTFWLGNEKCDTFQYAEGDEIRQPDGYEWNWKSEWGDPWIMPGYNLDIGPKVEQ